MFWLPFYESCRKTIYSCLPCLHPSDGAYGETVTATSGEYSNAIADYGGAAVSASVLKTYMAPECSLATEGAL